MNDLNQPCAVSKQSKFSVNIAIFEFEYIIIDQWKCYLHTEFQVFQTSFGFYSILTNNVHDN